MIKELINFTNNLSEDFKNDGLKPKEGLHILVRLKELEGHIVIDLDNLKYELYSSKMKEETPFIVACKFLSKDAWYIESNKAFDKGIHTASPYCVAFKRELLEGGGANVKDKEKNKKEIPKRFREKYFSNALKLLEKGDPTLNLCNAFKDFFVNMDFINVIINLDLQLRSQYDNISKDLEGKLKQYKTEKDKINKEILQKEIEILTTSLLKAKNEGDYIIFYLDLPRDKYLQAQSKYLCNRLFNTNQYNASHEDSNVIFGISNFKNSPDSSGNKPFWLHKTASFEVSGRISNFDAKALFDFEDILKRGTLPKPLPLFIYKEELQKSMISLFKESGNKLGIKEIVESLWNYYKDDFNNYYLLFWQNTKEGIIFQDFEFVPKFEFELDAEIQNLFAIKEKGSKGGDQKFLHYPRIRNVFEFEKWVFNRLIGTFNIEKNFNKIDYFIPLEGDDLKNIKKQYTNLSMTFVSYAKYRKAVYEFVYKSKRQCIDNLIFTDMVFSRIKDDIKNNNEYGIKEKLNIWFSLYEIFNNNKINTIKTMASKLKDYQDFVAKLAVGEAKTDEATDAQFAFAAGQVIEYVIQKSKTDNKSYQLLEPYLQQAKCNEFKKALANDISRYKHAINDNEHRFKNVCALVFSWHTDKNMKEFLPEILAGVFARNEFFTIKMDKTESQSNNS